MKTKSSTKDALTRQEWEAIYRSQKGLCAICDKALRNRYDAGSTGVTAAVDHCHTREKSLVKAGVPPLVALRRSIRALLCAYECNRMHFVRYWSDHPERLRRAFVVSTQFPAQLFISGVVPALPTPAFETTLASCPSVATETTSPSQRVSGGREKQTGGSEGSA
jgi:Recombination endonuclease VII